MIPYVKGDTVTCYYFGLWSAVVDEVINPSVYLLRFNQIGPNKNFIVAYYYELRNREPESNEPAPIPNREGLIPIGTTVTWSVVSNNIVYEYAGIVKDYVHKNKYLIYTNNPDKPLECVSAIAID
jgi:hypothetical protein